MHLRILALALLASTNAFAQERFVTERGNYAYTVQHIDNTFKNKGLTYLTLRPDRAIEGARYKLNNRSEFQIKDWFKRDWFAMQDMFVLDEAKYVSQYKGASFAAAKRNAYSKLAFNKKKSLHVKTVALPREWGGLNHPPIKSLSRPLSFYSARHASTVNSHSSYFNPAFHEAIDSVSKSELSFGNKLTVLEDRQAFQTKLRLIRNAQSSIMMSSLVFVCDIGTRQLTDLLINKHRAGVDVRIMADATISKYLSHRECLKKLKAAGVEVIEADDFWKYEGRTIYHSKNLIVDLKTAIAGGHNMIDADNLSRGVDFKNRDIDLMVTGPMVTDMAQAFVKDWTHFFEKKSRQGVTELDQYQAAINNKLAQERRLALRGKAHYATVLKSNKRMDGVCRFIRQSPYEDRHSIGKAYLKMLDGVKSYLAITNPVVSDSKVTRLNRIKLPPIEWADSFDMHNQLLEKVQSLAKAGLPIDYITTNIDMAGNENVAMFNEAIRGHQEDNRDWLSNWNLFKIYLSNAFYGGPHYENLLKDWYPHKNVHIWTHISFMHSKVFHFDRVAASIGSYNFQHNATDHAYEVTSICQDNSLNQQLDRVLVMDMMNSIPLVFRP